MIKKSFVIFLLFGCCLSSFASADTNLTTVLTKSIKQYGVPGVAVSYAFGNGLIHSAYAGVGNIKSNTPINSQTLFMVNSVTKTFISAEILNLQQQGKFKIDNSLKLLASKYPKSKLAEFVKQYPQIRIITVRQLLSHTSGLVDYLSARSYQQQLFICIKEKHRYCLMKSDDLLIMGLRQPVKFKPGAKGHYYYNSSDQIILGLIIKAVTHKPVVDNLKQLFVGAGIKDHAIYYPSPQAKMLPKWLLARLASSYTPVERRVSQWRMHIYKTLPIVKYQNKLLYNTTALDIAQFQIAPPARAIITNSISLVKWFQYLWGGKLLNMKSHELLVQPTPIPDSIHSYGLGMKIRTWHNIPVYYHDGDGSGFHSIVLVIPKYKLYLAMTTNLESHNQGFANHFQPNTLLNNVLLYLLR